MNKRYGNRWSASVGGGYTLADRLPEPASYPQQPEPAGRRGSHRLGLQGDRHRTTRRGASASRRCCATSRASTSRARSRCPAPAATPFGLTCPATTIYAEPTNANREDNIWVFDVRAEKTVNIGLALRTAPVPRLLQHHQQPRVGDDRPRDRRQLPEAGGHPGAAHRAPRLPLPLVGRIEVLVGSSGFAGSRSAADSEPRTLEPRILRT